MQPIEEANLYEARNLEVGTSFALWARIYTRVAVLLSVASTLSSANAATCVSLPDSALNSLDEADIALVQHDIANATALTHKAADLLGRCSEYLGALQDRSNVLEKLSADSISYTQAELALSKLDKNARRLNGTYIYLNLLVHNDPSASASEVVRRRLESIARRIEKDVTAEAEDRLNRLAEKAGDKRLLEKVQTLSNKARDVANAVRAIASDKVRLHIGLQIGYQVFDFSAVSMPAQAQIDPPRTFLGQKLLYGFKPIQLLHFSAYGYLSEIEP